MTQHGCHRIANAIALWGDCGPTPGDAVMLDEPSAVALALVGVLLVIVLTVALDLEGRRAG